MLLNPLCAGVAVAVVVGYVDLKSQIKLTAKALNNEKEALFQRCSIKSLNSVLLLPNCYVFPLGYCIPVKPEVKEPSYRNFPFTVVP
ncbi:hypothetical protein M0804_004966 [Polistes exclamans]|nr:hypothetical protein M0804_004966 [Polistes exclamans]